MSTITDTFTEGFETATWSAPRGLNAAPDMNAFQEAVFFNQGNPTTDSLLINNATSLFQAWKRHSLNEDALERFVAKKSYVGIVTNVDEDSFKARIFEENRDFDPDVAEFSIDELDSSEQKCLMQGAKFYWSLGYLVSRGTRYRASRIKFQRLPKITELELSIAGAKAALITSLIAQSDIV